jgi:hypothetical protein
VVIRVLISSLLDELDEADFETLFRNLLRSFGHTPIFERTRHGQGEHGKDIVSLVNKNGTETVFVFQLKVREINTGRFRTEVKPELEAMIQVPITHSLVKGNEPLNYVLVATGDFTPDAAIEFEAYNKHNLKKGDPEVKLWNKSQLTDFFFSDLSSLSILFPSFQEDVARIWLNQKSKKYLRSDWLTIVDKTLTYSHEKRKSSIVLGIATSFLATQARVKGDYLAAFDIYRISLVSVWATLKEGEATEIAVFDQLHDEYCKLIERFVQENSAVLSKNNGLFNSDNGMVETILYPIRTFSILGTLSYLAYFYGNTGNIKRESEIVSLIEEIINKNPSVFTPATDWLRKDIAITIVELCRNQRDLLAEKWIVKIFDNLHKRYILSGWVPSKSNVPEEIIEDTFHFKEHKVPRPTSSLIPLLFQFCYKLNLPAVYEKYSKMFYDFRLLEFLPPADAAIAEAELAKGNLINGTEVERKFPRIFKEYCNQVSKLAFKTYSPIAKNRRYVLQMISDIHQQYVFPEIYLDFQFAAARVPADS